MQHSRCMFVQACFPSLTLFCLKEDVYFHPEKDLLIVATLIRFSFKKLMFPLFLRVYSIPCIATKIRKASKAKDLLNIRVNYHSISELPGVSLFLPLLIQQKFIEHIFHLRPVTLWFIRNLCLVLIPVPDTKLLKPLEFPWRWKEWLWLFMTNSF